MGHRSQISSRRMVCKNIRVVNDSAERGGKLANDYMNSTKYQKIIQIVENSRHTLPD